MSKNIFLVVFFVLIYLLFLHPINASDFFHHLNTGRYISQHLSLPYIDDLTYTAYGKPWVAHSWGSGLIFYLIFVATGYTGISVLFALIGTLCCLFLYLILRNYKVNTVYSLVLTWLGAVIISLRWPTRPEVLGPLFLVTLVYLLLRVKKLLFIFPLFFLIWGIVYGSSAFLGIAVFIFFIIVEKKWNLAYILALVSSFMASLINGYGFSSFLYIFRVPSIAPHVGEWLPLHKTLNPQIPELVLFYQYTVLVYLLFVLLFFFILVIAVFMKKVKRNNFFLLGISVAILAPFYTNRFINLAPLFAIPIMGVLLVHFREKIRFVLLVLCILLALTATIIRFHNFSFGVGLDQNTFPTKITQFLKDKDLNGNIFSTQEVGAFLSWEIPESKVLVDTRDDLFQPLGLFKELEELNSGSSKIAYLLSKYPTHIVIGDIQNGAVFEQLFFNPEWKLVYITDGFFILVRRQLAEKFNLITYDSLNPVKIPPAKPGELVNAEKELLTLIDSDPNSIENQVRLIEVKLALEKPQEAKNLLEKLDLMSRFGAKKSLNNLLTDLLKAKVYLASGDCKKIIPLLVEGDRLSRNQLIFSRDIVLPSNIDLYFGEYYSVCDRNVEKAHSYLSNYLRNTVNPIEKIKVELLIKSLRNN